MPTGYTAKLMEHGQSFPDFAMLCARAFGACVEMRDDPMDAPIPQKFEPSDYHSQQTAELEKKLSRLNEMNDGERLAFGVKEKAERIANLQSYANRDEAENFRLDKMAKAVNAWTPPTEDHQGLKEFMLQQIETSRHRGDYWKREIATANQKAPVDFWHEATASAADALSRSHAGIGEEIKRAHQRTAWVQKLRESLKSV